MKKAAKQKFYNLLNVRTRQEHGLSIKRAGGVISGEEPMLEITEAVIFAVGIRNSN